MTLVKAAFGAQTLLKQALLVLMGAAFISLAAQVNVPMFPVPMTLQTLAILIVGLSFGARLGALTLLVYLSQGAMGLPVFANANNAMAFFGPTAGFLVGFVLLAWGVGYAADRGWTRTAVGAVGICALGSILLYIPGIAWPMSLAALIGLEGVWIGQGVGFYWTHFIAPFLLGDFVKSVLAALVVTGGLAALRNRTV